MQIGEFADSISGVPTDSEVVLVLDKEDGSTQYLPVQHVSYYDSKVIMFPGEHQKARWILPCSPDEDWDWKDAIIYWFFILFFSFLIGTALCLVTRVAETTI